MCGSSHFFFSFFSLWLYPACSCSSLFFGGLFYTGRQGRPGEGDKNQGRGENPQQPRLPVEPHPTTAKGCPLSSWKKGYYHAEEFCCKLQGQALLRITGSKSGNRCCQSPRETSAEHQPLLPITPKGDCQPPLPPLLPQKGRGQPLLPPKGIIVPLLPPIPPSTSAAGHSRISQVISAANHNRR